MINKYLTGTDQSALDPVTIKTNTTFWDNRLKFYNPLATKAISIRTLAVLNNYDFTIPLLSSNDEIVGLITAQQLQNKTIHINQNTIKHSSTNAIGDILVFNGTRYERVAMGTTPGYVLGIKSDLSGLEWISAPVPGVTGETNTGGNIGTAGVGVYHSKSGVQLRFKKINAAANGRILVTDDTTNNEIDIGLQGGTDGQFLKTVGTTPTWSTLTSQYGTIMPDGTNYAGSKWGRFMGGAHDGEGLFGGLIMHGETILGGTATEITTDFTSEASDDALAGFQTKGYVARRTYNPKLKFRFKHNVTTEKGWTGFLRSEEYPSGGSGDNPLADLIGAMVGYADADVNWLIRWNDGNAVPQTFNTGVAKNTGFHTVEFFLNNATNSVTITWDGVAVVNANTTQVPPPNNGMNVYSIVESVGGTATPTSIDYAYLTYN